MRTPLWLSASSIDFARNAVLDLRPGGDDAALMEGITSALVAQSRLGHN
jgi:hypothetical protein